MVRHGAFSAIALISLTVLDGRRSRRIASSSRPSPSPRARSIAARRRGPHRRRGPRRMQSPRRSRCAARPDPLSRHAADRDRPVRDRHRDDARRDRAHHRRRRSAKSFSRSPASRTSGFAPGSASRPIIRGLDNYRVGIQENGISSSGVSELGEDHAVPIDPLAAQKVEVIRGPATLRYGSQAIGGVVNAENNRIPTMIPQRGFNAEVSRRDHQRRQRPRRRGPARCRRRQFRVPCRHLGPQQHRLQDSVLSLSDAGSCRRLRSAAGSRIPRNRSNGGSIGGSYVFDRGFIGVAVSTFDSLYRVPGQEATATNTRIDMHQNKVTSQGRIPARRLRHRGGALLGRARPITVTPRSPTRTASTGRSNIS